MVTDESPANPLQSPSYPQRVHIREKAKWRAVLGEWEREISGAKSLLDGMAAGPGRSEFERLYAQMLGARDQIADAAARMPMEVGAMYEEDHHRLEEAVSALNRL